MENKIVINNGKPRIFSDDLVFEEVEDSKGTVNIELPEKKEETGPFKDGEEVEHLSNDYSYGAARASATPSETVKEEPKVDSKVYNVYDDLEEDSFNKYPFTNYTEIFNSSHKYTPNIDDTWDIVEFPSNCIFYDVDCIKCRPFKTRALAKLHTAISNKNFSGLLDILNMYIDIDIRDLTTPDFKFFMFWLRIKSFPSSELVVEWTSKYGNRNKSIINGNTALDFLKVDVGRDKVKEWAEKGYTFPRVRELEFSTVNPLTEEDRWLFDYAKYYVGSTPDDKVEEFEKHTATFNDDIAEFKKIFEHGIEEYVYARDALFNRDDYIKQLEDKLGFMHAQEQRLSNKEHLSSSEYESYDYICQMIGIMEEELYTAKNNENMVAEEEKIMLPFRSINLLPNISLDADSE